MGIYGRQCAYAHGPFCAGPGIKTDGRSKMVQVVSVDELTKEPKRFDFKIHQVDAWYESEESRSAWVYKHGDEIIALSPICKHLGCTVNWNNDPKNPNKFFCPCHYGLYEKTARTFRARRRSRLLTVMSKSKGRLFVSWKSKA